LIFSVIFYFEFICFFPLDFSSNCNVYYNFSNEIYFIENTCDFQFYVDLKLFTIHKNTSLIYHLSTCTVAGMMEIKCEDFLIYFYSKSQSLSTNNKIHFSNESLASQYPYVYPKSKNFQDLCLYCFFEVARNCLFSFLSSQINWLQNFTRSSQDI